MCTVVVYMFRKWRDERRIFCVRRSQARAREHAYTMSGVFGVAVWWVLECIELNMCGPIFDMVFKIRHTAIVFGVRLAQTAVVVVVVRLSDDCIA